MPQHSREQARTVWRRVAEGFDGVLVGPGPLVRELVDEGSMGHRSTLETIGRLSQADLLHVRQAAEGLVLWIPEPLMGDDGEDPRPGPGPRLSAARARNGSGERPSARA